VFTLYARASFFIVRASHGLTHACLVSSYVYVNHKAMRWHSDGNRCANFPIICWKTRGVYICVSYSRTRKRSVLMSWLLLSMNRSGRPWCRRCYAWVNVAMSVKGTGTRITHSHGLFTWHYNAFSVPNGCCLVDSKFRQKH